MIKFVRLLCFLAIALFITTSCNDDYYSVIPDAPVNINCDLGRAENASLLVRGNFKVYTKPTQQQEWIGYGGVLIVHLQSPMDESQPYAAYDMACPYEVEPSVKVEPQAGGVFAICPKCGSKFNILFGTGERQDGPAPQGLRIYKVRKEGNIVRVRN